MIQPGQSYTLNEISDAYRISRKVLQTWLRPILDQLVAAGYAPGQRLLTPRQVQIITHWIGEPKPTLKP